ncbi:MAG TPA: hypothetical protein V6D08_21580 [Candidatus Obscuribacterales bacterium]
MALSVEYSIFADKAIIEETTRKLSLIGMFNAVTPDYPVIPTVAFFCIISGAPGYYDVEVKISWVTEDEQETEFHKFPAHLEIGSSGRTQFTFNSVGLPLVGKGLRFRIYDGNTEIHQNTIPILERPEHDQPRA